MPEFAYALCFSYHFSLAGDEDFLSVEIEGRGRMASGLDTSLSRNQFMKGVFDVRSFTGQPIRLIFRLVSRGEMNAIINIKNICFKISNDIDSDGLTNAEESTARTSPYLPDSDFDGISDFQELSLHRTNPLAEDTDGDGKSDGSEVQVGTNPVASGSYFDIQNIEVNSVNGTLTLKWLTVPGRSYRVLRSERLDLEEFTVLGDVLRASGDTLSFDLPYVSPSSSTFFYWVQCVQDP